MEYFVFHNSEMSEIFKSTIGILIGDTCSPLLWNIYLAGLRFALSLSDISLDGCEISHLEQADDIMNASANGHALCSKNFMVLNAVKSMAMIFGPLPSTKPILKFEPEEVAFMEMQTYIGLTFQSISRKIFEEHCSTKAGKAYNSIIGDLPPWEIRKMYMALVDPPLTHEKSLLSLLEEIQCTLQKRLLGMGKQSIIPIKYRRLLIALNYLKYILQMPSDSYLVHAMRDSIKLAEDGKQGWAMGILYVLEKLQFETKSLKLDHLTREYIDEWTLKNFINSSSRTYLLKGCKEADREGRLIHRTLHFWHHLHIPNPRHRKALTRVILSGHCLAVERLRWRQPAVPQEERKCRFCTSKVEKPEHALLECSSNSKVAKLQEQFIVDISDINEKLLNFNVVGYTQGLKNLIASRDCIERTAEFAHEILSIYDSHPILSRKDVWVRDEGASRGAPILRFAEFYQKPS
ncbi:hypothetical protein CPB84DRAFT_1817407 [Gymnopilus junonius]|uniref:Uncharacterized protein n=1 Tax=Gymnopilus junonius TaxID=109634 RepID=A0A9P5TGX5_GYMJU|nr:hypothetical protein CPB84DRAFT_1817407 [Gymnopilus junonius]